jgi:hypothetical protein
MKTVKNFFIRLAIILLTFLQISWIVLTMFFRKKFWKRLFRKKEKKKADIKLPKISGFEKRYIVVVKNKSKKIPDTDIPDGGKKDKGTTVTLFGANQFLLKPKFGLPDNIEIGVPSSSYDELMIESLVSPFIIAGLRVSSPNTNQLDEVLMIRKRDASGQIASYPLQVGNYINPYQFQSTIAEIYPYKITITGRTQISFNIQPETELNFAFFVDKQVSLENLFESIAENFSQLSFISKGALLSSMSPEVESKIRGESKSVSLWREIANVWNEKVSKKKSKWLVSDFKMMA